MAFPTKSLVLVAASHQGAATGASPTGIALTGDFTVEFWYKTPGTWPGSAFNYSTWGKFPNTTNATLASIGNGSSGNSITDAALIIFKAGGETNVHLNLLSAISTTNTWVHFAQIFTSASGKYELVVNGVSQASDTSSLHSQNAQAAAFTVGYDAGASTDGSGNEGWTTGSFSMFRVWSTARSVASILANMCTVFGATAGLDAEWKFDNDYTDNSGNGNTMTGVGSPTFASDIPAVCFVASLPTKSLIITQAVKRAALY
jgi:hypothetical protein